MKKCLLYYFVLTVFILVPCLNVQAQFPTHTQTAQYLNANAFWAWYTGNGLDWSGGSPSYVQTAFPAVVSGEHGLGVSAVSDPQSGSLLFYTNGRTIWDKNHSVMPNGDGLLGNANGRTPQGSRIVPKPGDANQYYVFSLGGVFSDTAGLYYSVVDMGLNNGNGEVLPDQKNVPLDTNTIFTDGMVAVPGNNCNVWLLVHELKDIAEGGSNNYYAFEVSDAGVNATAVISQGGCDTMGNRVSLSVSPDRKKLALIDQDAGFAKLNWNITTSELSKFDPSTGLVSDAIPIVPNVVWDTINPANIKLNTFYESEFSPNGEILYLIENNGSLFGSYFTVSQMDISTWDSSAVHSSLIHIDTFQVAEGGTFKSYNDSIYVLAGNSNKIGRIAQPNNIGTACDLEWGVISLPLPNKTSVVANVSQDVVYGISSLASTVLDTGVCGTYTLNPSRVTEDAVYTWSDGSSDSSLVIDGPGTYWVSYTYFEEHCWHNYIDTFRIKAGSIAVPAEITINVNTLGTTGSYVTYQWLKDSSIIAGATDSIYEVIENGDYQVVVSDESGCIDTSLVYAVKTAGIRSVNGVHSIRLYPNPTYDRLTIEADQSTFYDVLHLDGRVIERNRPGKTVDVSGLNNGVYLIRVRNADGLLLGIERLIKLSK